MLGTLWYVGTILAAFVVMLPVAYPHLSLTETALAAVPVGTVGGAWLAFVCSLIFSSLSHESMTATMVLLIALVADRLPSAVATLKDAVANFGRERVQAARTLAVTLVVGAALWPVWSSRFLWTNENGGVMTGGSCWADLPIHLHIANSILYGRNADISLTDMHSPIFAGRAMTYPFLPDYHAAVLVYLGDSMRVAMLLPGFLVFVSFVGLLFRLHLRLTGRLSSAILGLALVAFAGGLGGLRLLPRLGWTGLLAKDPIQDDAAPRTDGSILWFAFLPHVMLPQRGATFAYPVLLVVLLLVLAATRPVATTPNAPPASLNSRRLLLITAAALSASLPLVQAHSFIALAAVIGVYFVLEAPRWLAHPRIFLTAWIPAGITAIVLAYPQLHLFQKMTEEGRENSFLAPNVLYKNEAANAGFRGPNPVVTGIETFDTLLAFFLRAGPVADFFVFWIRSLGAFVPIFLFASAIRFLPLFVNVVAAWVDAVRATPAPPAPVAAAPGNDLSEGGRRANRAPRGEWGQRFLAGDRAVASFETSDADGERPWSSFRLVVGATVVFFVGNWVLFQPWDRDNVKILYPWHFVAAAIVADAITGPIELLVQAATGRLSTTPAVAPVLGPDGRKKEKADDDLRARDAAAAAAASTPLSRLSFRQGTLSFETAAARAPKVAIWSLLAAVAAMGAVAVVSMTFSGFASLYREHGHNYELYGRTEIEVGEWIRANIPPKSVMLTDDNHRSPSGYYAGRPSLVGYTGWTWSHGYNYGERNDDRHTILRNMLKDSDPHVYNLLRKWGIRYVIAERPVVHSRKPSSYEDLFLDKQLKRVYKNGHYEIFEVLGYGFPPA